MHKIYDVWPKIAREQYKAELLPVEFEKAEHFVFAGMGGSGALNDVFSSILSKTDIHVDVVKGYLLPKTVNSKSIVITTSISGETEETLSILNSAFELGCKTISFSSGGSMEKFCQKNNLEYRKIGMEHSPRASFTSFLFSMLKVLEPVIPIEKKDILESIEELEKLQRKICSSNLKQENPSLNLANWITGLPVIYYPWGLQAAAIRFKNSLQENAKCQAIAEDIIEACHNGIVSWTKPTNFKPILVEGHDDYIKTKERWKILKEFFNEKNIDYMEIQSVTGSILSKLINLIYLFDYASIYRAVLSEIDPTPVEAIDFVKKRM